MRSVNGTSNSTEKKKKKDLSFDDLAGPVK